MELPKQFSLASMSRAQKYSYARSLWFDLESKSVICNHDGFSYGNGYGDLTLILDTPQKYHLEQMINPGKSKSGFYNDKMITDGRVKGWKFVFEKTEGLPFGLPDVVRSDSFADIIPIRFLPMAMEFGTGEIIGPTITMRDRGHHSFNQLSRVLRSGERRSAGWQTDVWVNIERWDELIALAKTCWDCMSYSQVSIERPRHGWKYSSEKPKTLRDLWSRFLHSLEPELNEKVRLILTSLGEPKHQTFDKKASESAINRALRKGRICQDRIKSLFAMLAAGAKIKRKSSTTSKQSIAA